MNERTDGQCPPSRLTEKFLTDDRQADVAAFGVDYLPGLAGYRTGGRAGGWMGHTAAHGDAPWHASHALSAFGLTEVSLEYATRLLQTARDSLLRSVAPDREGLRITSKRGGYARNLLCTRIMRNTSVRAACYNNRFVYMRHWFVGT